MDTSVLAAHKHHSIARPIQPVSQTQHSYGKKVVSCANNISLKRELTDLNQLEVRPSGVRCSKGAGLGLFTKVSSVHSGRDTPSVKKGEIFLHKITGIMALRHKEVSSGRYIEWLSLEDICVPISNDSHILWSPFKIRQDDEHEMELGVMPDGPVMFMNDSIKPNCRVNVLVKKGLKCTQDLVLTGLSNHEVPIEFELEALKPIQPGKELFWCYRPEAKRSKTSGNGSSSVSYRPSHVNGNHTQADYTAIESHMKSAFSGQFSVKRTDDLGAILQRRLKIETIRKKADLKYTPRESKFLPLIRRNQCTRGKVIEQAEINIIALKAYLKFRLNSCKDVGCSL